MTFARLLRRRASAQRGLLALVALVAAFVGATLVAVPGYVSLSGRAGLVAAFEEAGPTGAAVQLATPLSRSDPAAQAAAGDELLAATLAGHPVTVERSARSTTLTVAEHEVVAAADAGLASRVRVVAGTMPGPAEGGPSPGVTAGASLDTRTAALLGAGVGDVLTLVGGSRDAPLEVRVDAVWEATDLDDPRWFAEHTAAVWVTPDAVELLPGTVRVRWTVVPDPDRLTPAEVPGLRTALDASLAALKADDVVDDLGVLATDGLDTTLASADRTLAAVRAVSTPAVLLAVLAGVAVLAQLGSLLTDVRGGEVALLRARGATRARLLTGALAEGGVVGGAGGGVGVVAAAVALHPLGALSPAACAVAVGVVAALTGLALATATWLAVRGALGKPRADRAVPDAALLGLVGLAVAAAAGAVWRLRVVGSPVHEVAGRAVAEPLATAAVPLALLGVAAVVAAAVPTAARFAVAHAARRRDLRVLAAAHVARRPTAHAAAGALVALTAATSVVAAALLGTWAATREVTAAVRTGADVRVSLDEPGTLDEATALVRRAAPSAVVSAAAEARATLGPVEADLVAVPADVWADLPTAPGDTLHRAATTAGADGGGGPGPAPVPAVVSRALAADLGLAVGDVTEAVVPGHAADVEVVGLVDVVPGTDDPTALLVDLDAWQLPRDGTTPEEPREVWVCELGPDTARVASAVGDALTGAGIGADVTTGEPVATPLLDPALVAFRLAAWSTLALSLAGVLAAAHGDGRARRAEVAALRGLGVPPRTQGRLRAHEQVRVLMTAAAGGILGGAGVAVLTAVPLVTALAQGSAVLGSQTQVDVVALLGWLTVTGGALAAVVVGSARRTAARAATASPREVA